MASSKKESGRLVILCGPSCVGKSPLKKALKRHAPDLLAPLNPVVLYNSRHRRPGEVDGRDYHFRGRDEIEAMREDPDREVREVRGDLQALDVAGLAKALASKDFFYEGNPEIAAILLDDERLAHCDRIGVFMAPLRKGEILRLRDESRPGALPDTVRDLMRRKLLRRTRRQKGELSLPDLENVERRATSAYAEMQAACRYRYVLPNHDGEDSQNWDAFPIPLGDAGATMDAFTEILRGRSPAFAETWEADLLP